MSAVFSISWFAINSSYKHYVRRWNGYKLYWIAIGKTDFLYKANQEYLAKLNGMKMPHTYVESEGGHTWRNWRVYLSQFAPQLFE